jgi:3-carboxy-cis,cis-muconate cycloisomerase
VSATPPPFDLLTALFGDAEMAAIFSEGETIRRWLDAERALSLAQAELGVLTEAQAAAIAQATRAPDAIHAEALWRDARNVGYPILPLVRQVAAAVAGEASGRVHYGATTQDIMDTGLALQLRDALDRLETLVTRLGTALATQTARHRGTVMPGRTHAQQAVPTTFGAKMAVFLSELARHRTRLAQARPRILRVSLHGAGGTSAALGPSAAEIRSRMAQSLGLTADPVPWHVARDGVAEFSALCGMLAATCARFAREVIELSRTEIAEVDEGASHHRGASSTMPQKANPVRSEAVVGMAAVAEALAAAGLRAMEAGHERSAGEWQIEWLTVPALASLAAGCLLTAAQVAEDLRVHAEAMAGNLEVDGGLIMAEAHMIRLAPVLGREVAHDVVYDAVRRARSTGRPLGELLREATPEAAAGEIRAADYLGDAPAACDAAIAEWAAAGGA